MKHGWPSASSLNVVLESLTGAFAREYSLYTYFGVI